MKITSVRARLLIWNIVVLALVLFGFLFTAHVSIRTYLLAAIDNRLTEVAERQEDFINHVDSTMKPPPPPPDEKRSSKRLFRFQRMVRMFDLQGHEMLPPGDKSKKNDPPWDRVGYNKARKGGEVFAIIDGEDNLLQRVLSRPLHKQGKLIGVVQVATSYSEMQVLLDNLTTLMLILVPCSLIVAGIGGLFLTDRALRPVRQITKTAESLNPDDLSQRLPVVGADEFSQLSITMNRMLANIETAFTQVKQALELERRFTADASHELRTPLTAITANSSLALRGESTPEEYRQSLQAINRAAGMMQRLIDDLLLLARSDSGQLLITKQQVDIQDLFCEALEMVNRNGQQAEIEINVAPGAEIMQGDTHHLRRLLVNLLENALRYTPTDGKVRLDARLSTAGSLQIVVSDTGEGIAPEHLPHLCERFYRVDASRTRQRGGTGLGLAICKSIVEAHQGKMDISSAVGEGTRITMSFPTPPQA